MNHIESIWITIIVCVFISVMALMLINCGTNPNFWFDESGQFWMSKGLHHYSAPLSADGTFKDVIKANNIYNMDPGGYTFGLRWWMAFGTSPAWLRAFSFIFFVITMLAFAGTAYIWTKNWLICLAVGLVPAIDPVLANYAFELRPYSMEACGVALAVIFLELINRQPCIYRYFGLGLMCSIFLTSRYSFISTVIASSIGVAWTIKSFEWRRKVTFFAVFFLPILISCAGIYQITLSHQNSGSTPPDYVQQFILHGKSLSQVLSISANALFTPNGIGSTLFIVTYLFFFWRRTKIARYEQFNVFFIFVVSVNFIFIFLSLVGKYPWCPQARWGITLNLVAFYSWFPAIWMITCRAGLPERLITCLFSSVIPIAAIFAVLNMRPTVLDSIYENVLTVGPTQFYGKRVFVVHNAQATLRYLFEYGPLKQYASGIYPDSFIFEKSYNSKQKWDYFDYVIFSHMSDLKIHCQLGDSINKFIEVTKFHSSPIYRHIK
jgi:hypothetical protein